MKPIDPASLAGAQPSPVEPPPVKFHRELFAFGVAYDVLIVGVCCAAFTCRRMKTAMRRFSLW
jgi:hypothetical protein